MHGFQFFRETPPEQEIQMLLDTREQPSPPDRLEGLIKLITKDKVSAVIQAYKPAKACGPDGLGSDSYRNYSAELVPLLIALYNMWYDATVFPISFLERISLYQKGEPAELQTTGITRF
ncbi:hypothetical protein PC129_g10790 [Phytophthora cactorum]|uniref:Reverse transcriptase domain-containing protein n=1 Tax=Phytophthora cactorum TaxID=29920 RepID=A0A329SAP4_9STRA|nr:hypothetical protein Pcac1_g7250 [Phytophthora cactorum]KAG2805652.1 hypothetical protein PC111_g17712 [Phytophthora cactorum]KAG2821946.1 hypothetical protein PC112_g11157 [Phytophthora cactorum]KAG2856814.1 hypothetical protein PC113_g11245 [Phytophthora cactorum]KAG2907793.1 hypothetical protein PC114_g10715 [Phytophthora cactorum]